MPDVPTLPEVGLPALSLSGAIYLFAPGRTPSEVADRLNLEFARALRAPEVVALIARHGQIAIGGNRREQRELMRREYLQWAEVTRVLGIRPE